MAYGRAAKRLSGAEVAPKSYNTISMTTYLMGGVVDAPEVARRPRNITPRPPKPITIRAQEAGSGTPAGPGPGGAGRGGAGRGGAGRGGIRVGEQQIVQREPVTFGNAGANEPEEREWRTRDEAEEGQAVYLLHRRG